MLNYDFVCSTTEVTITIKGVKFKVKGSPKKSVMLFPKSTKEKDSAKVPVFTLDYGSVSIININNEEFNLWFKAEQYLLPLEFGTKLWRLLIRRIDPK